MFKLIESAKLHNNRIAVKNSICAYSYNQLLVVSENLAHLLSAGKTLSSEAKVAMMVNLGFDYIVVQRANWRAGSVAVPVCFVYPFPSLHIR